MKIMSENKPKRIAIVRCERTQESCPGTSCITSFTDKAHTFKEYGEQDKLVGFFSCGGCPGRRIFRLVRNLKEEGGVDVIHIASCILKETPFPKCLHKGDIINSIKKMGVDVVLGSDDKWEKELQIKKEKGKIESYEEKDELLEGEKHW
jgi:predicted metal-binding protein